MTATQRLPEPVPFIRANTAYSVPQSAHAITLALDANEGAVPSARVRDALRNIAADTLRRYPSKHALESAIAAKFELSAEQVLVTAGGDDAIDRCCRAMLTAGRRMIVPVPTFIMIERSAQLTGAAIDRIDWPGTNFPTEALIDAIDETTGLIALVSPNNPTGRVVTADDLERIAAAAQGTMIMLDAAYAEFTDDDLTERALSLPNVVVIRTFSKAYGLAGLRLGYALGPATMINWLRAAGGPYPTGGISLALGDIALRDGPDETYLSRVREERHALAAILTELGARPIPSEANFVAARFTSADTVRMALARRGIAVRGFPHDPAQEDLLRITCPGNPSDFARLTAALRAVVERSS